MELWHSLNGMLQAELVSADTAGAVTRFFESGITIYDAEYLDDLTVRFQIRRQDYKKIRLLAEKRGDVLKLLKKRGLYWTGKGLLKRPVLMLGILAILILGTYLPTRIFFIRVEGNTTVPTNLILEQAAQCGIAFGADRSEVRSEKMKNALLEAMPELQWAGINTQGCVATISVREREIVEKTVKTAGVSSIIAARDGVILSVTATRGSAVCKVGQAVKAGEVLISGYTDCGISIRAEASDGEVYALTEQNLHICTPLECSVRGDMTRQEKKYSLIIGKNRINFYKGSGISDTTCDRMYEENYITLPGGFVLPVAVVTEVWTYYDCTEETALPEEQIGQLSEFAADYLREQMVAGQILSASETVTTEDGALWLNGKYACREMIGRVQKEEIIRP